MRRRAAAAWLLLAVLLLAGAVGLLRGGSAPRTGAQTPSAVVGSIPGGGQHGLLVTGRDATVPEVLAALRNGGCEPASLAQLSGGFWAVYIVGAPAVVNAAFPESLPALAPFFVRCSPSPPTPSGTPVLNWVTPRGSYTLSTNSYRGGVLYTRNFFNQFTVTGGSGSIEITANLQYAGETMVTAFVDEGASYKLTVHLLYSQRIRGLSQILTLSAPSSPSKRVTIVGDNPSQDFWFFALGDLTVEPWTQEPPLWALIVTVMSGAGTVSADIGTLWGSAEDYHSADPYEDGTEVTLTAQPARGYIFDRWELPQSVSVIEYSREPPLITLRMTGNTQVRLYFVDECPAADAEPSYDVILQNDALLSLTYVLEALLTTIPQQLDEERAREILDPLVGVATGQVAVASCRLEIAERYRDELQSAWGLAVSVEPTP